jgi:hypothetical protein
MLVMFYDSFNYPLWFLRRESGWERPWGIHIHPYSQLASHGEPGPGFCELSGPQPWLMDAKYDELPSGKLYKKLLKMAIYSEFSH